MEPGGISGILIFNYTTMTVFVLVVWAYLNYYEELFDEELIAELLGEEEEEEEQFEFEEEEAGEESEEEEEEEEEEELLSQAEKQGSPTPDADAAAGSATPSPPPIRKKKSLKPEEPDPESHPLVPPVYHMPSGPRFAAKPPPEPQDKCDKWPPSRRGSSESLSEKNPALRPLPLPPSRSGSTLPPLHATGSSSMGNEPLEPIGTSSRPLRPLKPLGQSQGSDSNLNQSAAATASAFYMEESETTPMYKSHESGKYE